MFITICMTGLDQDMMQKNLTCKNLNEAKKYGRFQLCFNNSNFYISLLGALLYIYSNKNGINIPVLNGDINTDLLFQKLHLTLI